MAHDGVGVDRPGARQVDPFEGLALALKQNGCGGRTKVPHTVHRGADSRPSAAASQKGWVEPSAKGSCSMEGKVPFFSSVIGLRSSRSFSSWSVVQQRAADGEA